MTQEALPLEDPQNDQAPPWDTEEFDPTELPPQPDIPAEFEFGEVSQDSPFGDDAPLSLPVGLPEAPASFHGVMYRPGADGINRHWVSITIRGHDPMQTLKRFDDTCRLAQTELGWDVKDLFTAGGSTPPRAPTGHIMTAATSNEAAGVPPNQPSDRDDEGDDELHRVVVQVGGKVEFHVGKFKYPFNDGRAADKIAEVFDANCNMTAEKLSRPADYNLTGFGWRVKWRRVTKPSKRDPGKESTYYNVVRVYKAAK